MRKWLVIIAVTLCVAPPLAAAPAPHKARGPAGEASVSPPGRKQGTVRTDMKKILSGRDYRQLRRQANRLRETEEKKKVRIKKKDRGCDDKEGGGSDRGQRRQGCDGCGGQGCEGCGGAGGGGCAGVGAVAHGLLYLVVILAIVFLLGLIFYSISKYRKNKDAGEDVESDELAEEELMPTTPPGEHPSSVYLNRAMELAGAGDYKAAIRQLTLGGMSWIERHGLIRYRKGLTNRDYLRAVFRREPQRQGMNGMVTEFELVYFGRREATNERFQKCLQGYQAGFSKDDQELYVAPNEG